MTIQPNEALVEAVAEAIGKIANDHEIAKSVARAIIPIVQKAVEGEVVAWVRKLASVVSDKEPAEIIADAIENGEHRKA